MAVVTEKQISNTDWYSDPLDGTAKDNYERILELRKAFCHPLSVHKKTGQLNKEYFRTKTKETAMNWSDIEMAQLYKGIYKYGVDSIRKWQAIKSEFLHDRDLMEVRLKLSQLFGIQDLSIYADKTFASEKQIHDEFEKNKANGIANGTWNEQCGVSFKSEVTALSKEDERALQRMEFAEWKKNVYDNPQYVYRIDNARTSNVAPKKTKGKKKKAAAPKKKQEPQQKNTIDTMLKNKNEQKSEKMEMDADEEVVKEKKSIPKKKKATKKKKAPAKKKAAKGPEMPEESDDDEMLCVE